MNRVEKYNKLLAEQKTLLAKTKVTRNIYITLKFLLFAAFATCVYHCVAGNINIAFAVVSLAAYITILRVDAARARREAEIKCYIALYMTEIAYLGNDLTTLDGGYRYVDTSHNYSFDLDLFGPNSLFAEINRGVSPSGSDLLATWLKEPLLSAKEIVERQKATEELAENIGWTHRFRVLGESYPVGEFEQKFIDNWKSSNYKIYIKLAPLLYALNAAAAITLSASIFGALPYGYFVSIATIQLCIWVILMRAVGGAHIAIDSFVKNISNYFYLIDHFCSQSFSAEKLNAIKHSLEGEASAREGFHKLKKLKSRLDSRNNIIGALALNTLYLSDAHTMIAIARWHHLYIGNVEGWVKAIDKVDALVSMANYRYNHPEFCTPQPSTQSILRAQEMVHPLIKSPNAVANDIEVREIDNIYIVTGANMSGKSTFLRGVGLNMVLALTGNVARASNLEFRPIALFTSMRTSDNLSRGESYFHAELLRLKALHDNASGGKELFVILDEMLKGTNSEDKLNGSRRFLVKLLELNVAGIVATHDLQLGLLNSSFPKNFYNICFEIEQRGSELHYSYKLQEGVSKNMNASLLLEQMKLI